MFTIKKVLNTSVVLVQSQQGEMILLGKGIGFGKKAGDILPAKSDYQWFIPIENGNLNQTVDLIASISQEVLEVAVKVIKLATRYLQVDFDKNMYLSLADHINFAIERQKQGMVVTNRLVWEMQSFYPKEYEVGLACLELINQELEIHLPEEEAVNITFYLVNMQTGHETGYDSAKYAKLIGNLVNIIQYSINTSYDKNSMAYHRLVVHLRFFVERFFGHKMLDGQQPIFNFQDNATNFALEFAIVQKIKNYIYDKYQQLLPEEEVSFLIIHINRLLREK